MKTDYASCVLIIKDNLVLAVTRGKGTDNWALPGGKQEIGETPKQTAKRELFEETGIIAFNLNLVYEAKNIDNWFTSIYIPEEYIGNITPSDEGDVAYVPINKIKEGSFGVYNIKMLKALKIK
jgi:8-oxo-dGTP pyrophosphatase MutT (NUDIX family)